MCVSVWGRIYQGKAGSKRGKVTTHTGRGNTPHFLTAHTQIFLTAKFSVREVNSRDKCKKYKPIDTNVGYDQRDDTLVMDDFLSRFFRPSLPLFCCVVMIRLSRVHTHRFVPVIVLLCSTMRISSAHYTKTFLSVSFRSFSLLRHDTSIFENCLKVCGKNLRV